MRKRTVARIWTLAPALILFAAVALLPIGELVAMSLARIDWAQGQPHWRFVGLEQYARVLGDALFRAGVANTAIFAIVGVLFQMVLGFALALLTTQVTRGRVLYRTVFILPILVPGIVIGAIWKLMYNFDFGVVNQMIGLLGIGPVDWLGRTSTALLATETTSSGVTAGLRGPVMEATTMPSAPSCLNALSAQAVFVPGGTVMLPVIVVTLVFRIIVGVKVFDEIYLLTGGGPGTATEVVSYTIFRRFFTEGQTGYGAAMSVVVLFALALIFLIARATTQRRGTIA